ncbi:MAG: acyl dehydratase [Chloroflexi bacterium]|nr:acyl dehydratase [Chloroflexota bacterium]
MNANDYRKFPVRYWDDVREGDDLPALAKKTSTIQLTMYTAATGIFHRIHYDLPFAKDDGLPGVLVHGPLHGAFITQVVTDWMGPRGFLKKVGWNNRGMAIAEETLTCKGLVKRKYTANSEHLVDCEIWNENEKGERLVVGSATVRLPRRGA